MHALFVASQLDAAPTALAPSTFALYAAALLVLVVAALTSAKPFLRLVRRPIVSAYVGAGWMWVAFGLLIGPSGLNVLSGGMIDSLRPLILIALGWVGLTVGLQLNAPVLRMVPGLVWRWAAMDLVVCSSVALVAVAALAPHWMATATNEGVWLLMPIAIVCATLLGWNPETRSMLPRATRDERTMARLATGTSGLTGVMAVLVVGVLSQFVVRNDAGMLMVSLPLGFVALGAAAGLALCAGIGVLVLLPRSDWTSSRTLIVLMSIAALASGISMELAFSPLLSTLFCGVAIANLPGKFRFSVWQLLSRSERAVSTTFFILAGALLAAPASGAVPVLALVAACLATRLVLKPVTMHAVAASLPADSGPNRVKLRQLPTRQSALAIVIAVAMVLAEDSMLRRDLLLVVVTTGAACAAWPLLHRTRAAQREAMP
ncbi:MAG: hypothetical protein JNK53_01930 [Phycisphaerae bacterium]|nr:hypothetical protein [Phycisphaerae bacterium]